LLWLKDTALGPPEDDIDTSGCDKTKACFLVPDGCTTDCDYILTWTNSDQAVSFEMSASASSDNYWVALGFSDDQKMVGRGIVEMYFRSNTRWQMGAHSWKWKRIFLHFLGLLVARF